MRFESVPDAIRAATARYKARALRRKRPRQVESEFAAVPSEIMDITPDMYESLPNKSHISDALEEWKAVMRDVDEKEAEALHDEYERINRQYYDDGVDHYSDYHN